MLCIHYEFFGRIYWRSILYCPIVFRNLQTLSWYLTFLFYLQVPALLFGFAPRGSDVRTRLLQQHTAELYCKNCRARRKDYDLGHSSSTFCTCNCYKIVMLYPHTPSLSNGNPGSNERTRHPQQHRISQPTSVGQCCLVFEIGNCQKDLDTGPFHYRTV